MRAITFSFFGIARSNQFCWIAIQPNWQRRKGSKNLFKPWEWNKGTWRIKTHMKFGMWKLNLIWIEYSWRVSLTLTVLVFGEGVCEFQLKLLGQHNLFQFTFRCGKMESLSTRLHQSTKSVPTDEKKTRNWSFWWYRMTEVFSHHKLAPISFEIPSSMRMIQRRKEGR